MPLDLMAKIATNKIKKTTYIKENKSSGNGVLHKETVVVISCAVSSNGYRFVNDVPLLDATGTCSTAGGAENNH